MKVFKKIILFLFLAALLYAIIVLVSYKINTKIGVDEGLNQTIEYLKTTEYNIEDEEFKCDEIVPLAVFKFVASYPTYTYYVYNSKYMIEVLFDGSIGDIEIVKVTIK